MIKNSDGSVTLTADLSPLEAAALRLQEATIAAKERRAKMAACVCIHEASGEYDRPCWRGVFIMVHPDDGVNHWEHPAGDDGDWPGTWCGPCRDREKLRKDRTAIKELGAAKRALWVEVKRKRKERRESNESLSRQYREAQTSLWIAANRLNRLLALSQRMD